MFHSSDIQPPLGTNRIQVNRVSMEPTDIHSWYVHPGGRLWRASIPDTVLSDGRRWVNASKHTLDLLGSVELSVEISQASTFLFSTMGSNPVRGHTYYILPGAAMMVLAL